MLCVGDGNTLKMMTHYKTKLKDLYLNRDTSATKYVNIYFRIVCLGYGKFGGFMDREEEGPIIKG